MPLKKRPMTGRLLKAIHIDDARARGLRASFALDPDENDMLAHVEEELRARWAELDKFFGLKANGNDIWQQRAKALLARQFNVDLRDPRFWERIATKLALRHVPGFSVKGPGQKRHGAPPEWNDEQLCQLFADVELLKKTNKMSVREVCKELPKRKGYRRRWGRYGSYALRKEYAKANRFLRQNLRFQLKLCDLPPGIPTKRNDCVEAAIRRHALKLAR